MPQMSVRAYARYRGVSHQSISFALRRGRISRSEDGMIDSEQADRSWEANTNPRRSAAGKVNGAIGQALRRRQLARQANHQSEPAPEGPQRSPGVDAFAKARAVRERYAALLLKLEYEERSGKLIDRSEVTTAAFKLMRTLRDSILAVPDRIAAQAAAENDAAVVHRMIETELRGVLDQVAIISRYNRGDVESSSSLLAGA